MLVTDPMVLPEDVLLVPVRDLPEGVRRQVEADESDYAVTRRNSRTPSRIIDSDAAELLKEFRRPITVVQAVIQYSREKKSDPEQTLEAAYPMLERLASARVLVPIHSDEAQRIEPTLEPGNRWGSMQILQCVQSLEDSELYRVQTSQGQQAALKILRRKADSKVVHMFDREAAILTRLDSGISPRLLANGVEEGRRYLLLEWCSGVECSVAAAEYRQLGGLETRRRLSQLCGAILDAYAQLHAKNVIHSDIHPRNILVDESGAVKLAVKLIDFGLSRIPGIENEFRRAPRGGVAFFFEPEYAEAARSGKRLPYSSERGEQYGLAALLYFLVTGANYLDFSMEKQEMLRQIAQDPPLPFVQRGIEPWPGLEQVLTKALSKHPSDRFSSVADFAENLKASATWEMEITAEPEEIVQPAEYPDALNLLCRMLLRLQAKRSLFESGLQASPKVSVTYGSAGIAYGLYRIACARGDPELLALADLWAARAARDIGLSDAFYSNDIEITPQIVGGVSPYHTASGVHVVQGLIGQAMGDMASQQIALEKFLVAAQAADCESFDVTLGQSGLLLAAARLLDSVSGDAFIDSTALLEFGHRKFSDLWGRIKAFAPIRDCREISYSGAAHGWAGILYAVMSWCQSSGAPLPVGFEDRLLQLAKLAECSGRRAHWPYNVRRRRHEEGPTHMPGWCNGSAGFVFTWTLAYQMFGKPEYSRLALQAGFDVWESGNQIGNLCCGFAGQAYALLNLYKQTGEKTWLHRAQTQAQQAARSILEMPTEGAYHELAIRAESLYKGELGVAVLAAELEQPESATMPFFEREG